jgi:membrane protease YdiL (CAAX protease family)
MSTTSSETSTRPSLEHRSLPALAIWLALAAVFVGLAFYGQGQGGGSEDVLYEPEFAVAGVVSYAILAGLAVALALFYERPRQALGFRSFERRWLWRALGVVVATIVVSLVLEPFLHAGEEQGLAPAEWKPEHAEAFAANVGVAVLVGPFAEELFFRGVGTRVLGFLGGTTAIVGTALVFALVHGLVVALPALVFFGVGLAWVRLRSGSIWPSVLAHSAYNGLGLVILAVSWALDLTV